MSTILTIAALAALVAAVCGLAPDSAQATATTKRPAVFAHQGAEKERPSNTVASFSRAAELGVGSEMDVQAAKDGRPVIMHDLTVDATTDGTGKVAELDWSYLSKLRATKREPWNTSEWKDEHIPDLDQALTAAGAKGLPVILDMHYAPTKEQFDRVWECLVKHGMTDRVTILGNPQILGNVRTWYPTLNTEIIEYPPSGYIRSAESAKSFGATYGLASRYLTEHLVAYYHASGLKVASWTSDSPAEDNEKVWAQLVSWGVDVITTSRPAELLAWLEKNGK